MLFIQLVNSISDNLNNPDFTQFLSRKEFNFIEGLTQNNIALLNEIFDSIRRMHFCIFKPDFI